VESGGLLFGGWRASGLELKEEESETWTGPLVLGVVHEKERRIEETMAI
jgi:hypothetical protein